MNIKKVLALTCVSFFLFACSTKGIDKELETTKGPEAYFASLQEATKDMPQEETDAFNWAVSDITTLEALNQRYPNQSPRHIIRTESKQIREKAPARIAELEALKPKYDAILTDLKKIEASNVSFHLAKSFHGLQPKVEALIANRSSLPVSSLRWYAELYLDDGQSPVATYRVSDDYSRSSGLPPGAEAKRLFTIGFVTGDANWITLEVRNAKKHRVTLTPILETVADYGNRAYLQGAPYQSLENWKNALATAEKYSKY